jgi:hypothetical protein
MITRILKLEPAAIAGVLTAAINAVQIAAVPLPTWVHTLIAAASILAAALAVRQNVTPTPPDTGV